MLDDIVPLPYARETLIEIRRRGYRLALASSGKPEHTEHYLDMLAARSVAEAWTTSQDVEATKPARPVAGGARQGGARPVLLAG